MERRTARQLRPLDEDDVVPAEPGEPVEDRAAAHSAADDDRPRTISHGATLIPARRLRGPSIAARGLDRDVRKLREVPIRDPLNGQVPLRRFVTAPSTGRR